MSEQRSTAVTAAAALLGVIAVAAFVTGVLFMFAAWAANEVVIGRFNDIGQVATVLIGLLILVYGGLATYAARKEWTGRPVGRVMGLIVALVLVLLSVIVLTVGEPSDGTPLLAIAAALGVLTLVPLTVQHSEVATPPDWSAGTPAAGTPAAGHR
jgi:cytochrome bd-type quinol oxidase subunit 2